MNPGKTHLINALQPTRLAVVAAELDEQIGRVYSGNVQSPYHAQLTHAAQEELLDLIEAYNEALYRHAAKVVWEEEYVEEPAT